jgi:thymidylate synthase ThyX
MKQPSAKLLSTIAYPVETIYLLWQASRSDEPLPSAAELKEQAGEDLALAATINETFLKVIESDIPVAENLDVIFILENIPISLREQIVRHRIGHHFGDNFAVDIIPGDGRSSWWSQSMRVKDMGLFASQGDFYMPESIAGNLKILPRHDGDGLMDTLRQGALVKDLYESFMEAAQELYAKFVDAGVPPEDARQVLPLAVSHRISWKMNYMSLKHIMGRRGCWIAQLGMWQPLITDMVNELATKVHPVFRSLVRPPCLNSQGCFMKCPFVADNLQRLMGKDPEPPCAAFLNHHSNEAMAVPAAERYYHPAGDGTWDATDPARRTRYRQLLSDFTSLWGRSAYLGAV